MMSLSPTKVFTFTWQVQNFSMCPQKFKESIMSPVFVVHELKESEWRLELYPNGSQTEGVVSCFLHCTGAGYYTGVIEIGFRLTLISSINEKSITYESKDHTFTLNDDWGYEFAKNIDILAKDIYLDRDTLTFKCSLWQLDDSDCESISSDIVDKNSVVDSQNYFEDSKRSDGCLALTRIPVQEKTVFWHIRSFSSIKSNKKITMCVHSALKDEPSFLLTLYKSPSDQNVEIEIRRLKTKAMKQMFVKCLITVHNSVGMDEYLFEPDANGTNEEVWNFITFLNIRELQDDKYFHHTCDSLLLDIEFAFSQLDNKCPVVNFFSMDEFTFSPSVYHAIDEFGQLYKSGEMSDIKLQAGDKEFKVHQVILKARSPVFSAMLEKDMKEKKTGIVEIIDVDPDTIERMVGFMYTNVLDDLLVEDAIKLWTAADKYQILPLKLRCTWILKSKISVANICAVLNLADVHQDMDLQNFAERFFHANYVEILKSLDWLDFMKTNGTVAAMAMYRILVN